MSRVLITGIGGMVGSHLADFLLENTEWEIYGLVRWNDSNENIEHLSDRINKKDTMKNKKFKGISTLTLHTAHQENNNFSHTTPIYATSTFTFDTAEEGMERFKGTDKTKLYTNDQVVEQLQQMFKQVQCIHIL